MSGHCLELVSKTRPPKKNGWTYGLVHTKIPLSDWMKRQHRINLRYREQFLIAASNNAEDVTIINTERIQHYVCASWAITNIL